MKNSQLLPKCLAIKTILLLWLLMTTPLLQTPNNNELLVPLPNQVLEVLTIIQKSLAHQKNYQEIKITTEKITTNEKLIYINYEACKICKVQHGNFILVSNANEKSAPLV